MRTAIIIIAGLVLLGFTLLAGRYVGGTSAMLIAVKVFVGLWLVLASFNLWMGVSGAGYSFAEELPIFLVVFAVPAGAAAIAWWRLSSAGSP
jgi:hypothetical protein